MRSILFPSGIVFALTLVASKSALPQNAPPCALEPSVTVPTSPECKCYDFLGSAIPCPSQIPQPYLGDLSCAGNNLPNDWSAVAGRLFRWDDQDQTIKALLENSAGRTLVPFSHDASVSVLFSDLLFPPDIAPGNLPSCGGSNPFGLQCQLESYRIVLAKEKGYNLETATLDQGKVWTDIQWWPTMNAIFPSSKDVGLLSSHYQMPCLEIPKKDDAGKPLAAGNAFLARTFAGLSGAPDYSFLPIALVHKGVTAPVVTSMNVDNGSLVEGNGTFAKFALKNLGEAEIARAMVRVVASTKEKVLEDPNRIVFLGEKGEWFALTNGGNAKPLDSSDLLGSISNIAADSWHRFEPAEDPESFQIDFVLPPPNIGSSIVPAGKQTKLYFAIETVVIKAQWDSPMLSAKIYPPHVESVSFKPVVKIKDAMQLSPSVGPQGFPELSVGGTETFSLTIKNESIVPTDEGTVLKVKAKKSSSAKGGKTIAEIPIGSILGNSSKSITIAASLKSDEKGFFKDNKVYVNELVVAKYLLDKPGKAVDTLAGNFKYREILLSAGLVFDADYDGKVESDEQDLPFLVSVNDNDSDQDGVADNQQPSSLADPDRKTLLVTLTQCGPSGVWYLEYPLGPIKIFDALGNVIVPGVGQPCAGQSFTHALSVVGNTLSAAPNDISLALRYSADHVVSPLADLKVDEVAMTVFKTDLSSDKNYDDQVDALDTLCFETKGSLPQIIWWNSDDDDLNGKPDHEDDYVPGEDNLALFGVALQPEGLAALLASVGGYSISLHADAAGKDNLKAWSKFYKGSQNEIDLSGHALALGQLPEILYLEGTYWDEQVATLHMDLIHGDDRVSRASTRLYPSHPVVFFPSAIVAGEEPVVSVTGLPPQTPVQFRVYRVGSSSPAEVRFGSVHENLLTATTTVKTSTVAGESFYVEVLPDGGCSEFKLVSNSCTILPSEAVTIEFLGNYSAVADGQSSIPVEVFVKDVYQNPVADGTEVAITLGGDEASIKTQTTTVGGKATALLASPIDVYFTAKFRAGSAEALMNVFLESLVGEIDPPAPTIQNLAPNLTLQVGAQLEVALRNSNATDGTEVFWTVSNLPSDKEHTFTTVMTGGESILKVETVGAQAGVCTVTATMAKRGWWTAVYLTSDKPHIVLEKSYLAGDQTEDGFYNISETKVKPAAWPTQWDNEGVITPIPSTIAWSHTGSYFAKTKAGLLNAKPNTKYLLHLGINNPLALNLSIYQEPGDLGYNADSPGGVNTDALGKASFTVRSLGFYEDVYLTTYLNLPDEIKDGFGLEPVIFTIYPTDSDPFGIDAVNTSITMTTTSTAALVWDTVTSFVGGDPEAVPGYASAIAGGMCFGIADVGSIAKNAYRGAGGNDKPVDVLEVNLAMAGLGLEFFGPSGEGPDAIISGLRALSAYCKSIGADDLAEALARVVLDILDNGFSGAQQINDLTKFLAKTVDFDFMVAITQLSKLEDFELFPLIRSIGYYGDPFVAGLTKSIPNQAVTSVDEFDDWRFWASLMTNHFDEIIKGAPELAEKLRVDPNLANFVDGAIKLTWSRVAPNTKSILEFKPPVIDGVALNYGVAKLFDDLLVIEKTIDKIPGSRDSLLFHLYVFRHLTSPNISEARNAIYRLRSWAQIVRNVEATGVQVAFTAVDGGLAPVRLASSLPQSVRHLEFEAPPEIILHQIVNSARYSVGNTEDALGAILSDANVLRQGLEFTSHNFTSGATNVLSEFYLVIPSLDELTEATIKRIEQINADHGVIVKILHIPENPPL